MCKSGRVLAVLSLAGCSTAPSSGTTGPPPPTPVVVTRSVDATAAQCPFGGTVVESGLDLDGDGALGDGEVAAQTVVCQPMPITPPQPQTLLRVVDEPAGPHCVVGGSLVESGPDQDGNGVLDDPEVTAIEYLCSDVAVGDLSIIGRRDAIERYASIRAVTGSLEISIQDLGSAGVGMPALQHVGGSMSVFNSYHIAYPALRDVSGALLIVQAATAEFPALTRVGSLSLFNANLTDLSGFPALQRIDDSLSIGDSAVTRIDLSLDVLRDFGANTDRQLTEIHVHVNHAIGDVYLVDNGALSSLTLDVPGAASLDVERNPQLPTCQVQAIADRLVLSNAKITGNDDSATCAP